MVLLVCGTREMNKGRKRWCGTEKDDFKWFLREGRRVAHGEEVPMISVVFGQFGKRMMCLVKFYNNPRCIQRRDVEGATRYVQ